MIGVGGGRDVLSALVFDQKSVTGVEINDNILDTTNKIYGDFTGHLDRDPRVQFVNDEARSYLARDDKRYDIIQISLIDTWAATSAGAFALSENSLYTTEAWNIFLDRLKPDGVLSVSRWYRSPIASRSRRIAPWRSPRRTLKDRGVANPRDHMLICKGRPTASAALARPSSSAPSRSPRRPRPDRLREAAGLQFTPVLTPDHAIDPTFAGLAAPAGPGKAIDALDEDISPPTDNRPFFFQMADLHTFLRGGGSAMTSVTRPVLVLALLALTVLAPHRGCIVVPLLLTTKRAAPTRHSSVLHVLRRDRAGLPAHRDLTTAATEHLPRPPDLRVHRRAVHRAALQRHREHGHRAGRPRRTCRVDRSCRSACCCSWWSASASSRPT